MLQGLDLWVFLCVLIRGEPFVPFIWYLGAFQNLFVLLRGKTFSRYELPWIDGFQHRNRNSQHKKNHLFICLNS